MVVYYYDAQCPVAQYGECGGGMVKMIPGALSDTEKKNNNHGVGVSLASHGELCTVCRNMFFLFLSVLHIQSPIVISFHESVQNSWQRPCPCPATLKMN